jgi:hypothetical protein
MISEELKQKLKEKGQFPYGKRDRAYQSIDGNPGIRDMEHRYEVIQFPKSFDGETVIDFGNWITSYLCSISLMPGLPSID